MLFKLSAGKTVCLLVMKEDPWPQIFSNFNILALFQESRRFISSLAGLQSLSVYGVIHSM